MEIQRIDTNNCNLFINEFKDRSSSVASLYHYTGVDLENCKLRLKAIDAYSKKTNLMGNRFEISLSLQRYHKELASLNKKKYVESAVIENIQQYAEGCYTVITGQQAGLLTGPAYTINKTISLLKAVKELKSQFNVKVIPIFWVAGEDHDIDEIDHANVNTYKQLKRLSIAWSSKKPSISVANVELTKEQIETVLADLTKVLPDSEFKKEILCRLHQVYMNTTLSIAFAALMYDIFSPFGLVLFDSHDETIRRLQIPVFSKIIKEPDKILKSIDDGYKKIIKTNHKPQVEVDSNKIGIYTNKYGKRRAVRRHREGFAIDQIVGYQTQSELLEALNNEPQMFSTNVLLRPIMQEYLFQPLLYIGGAAEVRYWGQLKSLFELFEYKMPIIALRNSYTYATENLLEKARKYSININDVIANKLIHIEEYNHCCDFKEFDFANHFQSLEYELEKTFNRHIKSIPHSYVSSTVSDHIVQKHWRFIKKQLLQIENDFKIYKEEKSDAIHMDINWMERELVPSKNDQERVLNIYQFINFVGPFFIKEIINDTNHTMSGAHYIVNI